MTIITVKKEDLINELKKNRDAHQEEYNNAYVGYKQLCIEALEEKLATVNEDEDFDMYFNEVSNPPDDHTQDYQNVIDILEIGEDDTIKLGVNDYMKYYKNNWEWRRSWGMSNATYLGKFGSM